MSSIRQFGSSLVDFATEAATRSVKNYVGAFVQPVVGQVVSGCVGIAGGGGIAHLLNFGEAGVLGGALAGLAIGVASSLAARCSDRVKSFLS